MVIGVARGARDIVFCVLRPPDIGAIEVFRMAFETCVDDLRRLHDGEGMQDRVLAAARRRPLVYDSIHLCGCYHMFFPTPAASPIPPPDPNVEWAFVPRTLPVIEAPQRVVVRMTTRSHYLIDVHPDAGGGGTSYAMANDSELRTIPTAEGTRSAFGPTRSEE